MSEKQLFCFNDNLWTRLLLGVTAVAAALTLIWGQEIGSLQLLGIYAVLFVLWWVLAKLNWKQVFATGALVVIVIFAGRFFDVWRIIVSDYLGFAYWLFPAALVAMWAVAYASCLLAKLLFAKWPKLKPEDEMENIRPKKLNRFIKGAVFNEFVVVILFASAATLLADINYFVLGAAVTILFMRWFVSNNAERVLVLVSVIVGLIVVYLGTKFGVWGFNTSAEVFAFPLWVPASTGIFAASAYRILDVLSLKKT